ncbi:MAG: hypothetical protein KGL46_09225 [Hyphomicrobiales bacterium]|nr:hypothetical protein [Hyphomicrobiales bacterium]
MLPQRTSNDAFGVGQAGMKKIISALGLLVALSLAAIGFVGAPAFSDAVASEQAAFQAIQRACGVEQTPSDGYGYNAALPCGR